MLIYIAEQLIKIATKTKNSSTNKCVIHRINVRKSDKNPFERDKHESALADSPGEFENQTIARLNIGLIAVRLHRASNKCAKREGAAEQSSEIKTSAACHRK